MQQIEDAKEVKSGLNIEESNLSDDPNRNNVPKNSKFKPVKIVKEDPETRLRLSNQLKELKLKESALQNQLKEVSHDVVNIQFYVGLQLMEDILVIYSDYGYFCRPNPPSLA